MVAVRDVAQQLETWQKQSNMLDLRENYTTISHLLPYLPESPDNQPGILARSILWCVVFRVMVTVRELAKQLQTWQKQSNMLDLRENYNTISNLMPYLPVPPNNQPDIWARSNLWCVAFRVMVAVRELAKQLQTWQKQSNMLDLRENYTTISHLLPYLPEPPNNQQDLSARSILWCVVFWVMVAVRELAKQLETWQKQSNMLDLRENYTTISHLLPYLPEPPNNQPGILARSILCCVVYRVMVAVRDLAKQLKT
jgi:maltoporin